jgi:hypothetical protein
MNHVWLQTVCGTGVKVQMAQMRVWLGKQTSRHLCRKVPSTRWVASRDDITAQLKDGDPGDASIYKAPEEHLGTSASGHQIA